MFTHSECDISQSWRTLFSSHGAFNLNRADMPLLPLLVLQIHFWGSTFTSTWVAFFPVTCTFTQVLKSCTCASTATMYCRLTESVTWMYLLFGPVSHVSGEAGYSKALPSVSECEPSEPMFSSFSLISLSRSAFNSCFFDLTASAILFKSGSIVLMIT